MRQRLLLGLLLSISLPLLTNAEDAPTAKGLRYERHEIRRKPPMILEAMGPIAFGKRTGDDVKMPIGGLGNFGAGNVKSSVLKFIPEGSQNEIPNGGTYNLPDNPSLGYMERETTAGKTTGTKTKMNILGLGRIESNDETEQGTGLLDFSKSLFPFLQLPALKTDPTIDRENTDVDPRLGEIFYSRASQSAPQTSEPVEKNPHFIPSVHLGNSAEKEIHNPFDSVSKRPRIHAAKTHQSEPSKTEDLDLISDGEGFIPQKEVVEERGEPVAFEPKTTHKFKDDGVPIDHKVNHALGRVPISQLGLGKKDIYTLCSKFATIAAKVCYGPKVSEEWVVKCQGYHEDCSPFIAESKPLGAIANAFNSGVGLTFYDWGVNGIPFYPVNEEGGIGNGHHGKVDFGSWGGGYSDNLGVRDFWSQTGEYGANWYEGTYGYKSGWSIPIVQSMGVEGGGGTQVNVPLKEGEIGKPISVTNGYHVGPYMGIADRVGVDWYNGGVSFNKGFAVPFIGVNVNSGTSIGFPSVGHIMNRMGLNGLDALNQVGASSSFGAPGIAAGSSTALSSGPSRSH